jgi:anti-anti-sigma regulatory factor
MITHYPFSVEIRFCNDTVVLEGKGSLDDESEEYLDKILEHLAKVCTKTKLDLEKVPSITSKGIAILEKLCERYNFLDLKNSSHLTLLFEIAKASVCLKRQA